VKTILVTGSSGFVGRELVSQLVADNRFKVKCISRRLSLKSAAAEYFYGDLNCPQHWITPINDVDTIIHTAARAHVLNEPSIDPLVEFGKVNVDGTLRIAELAAKMGVKRFIFLSSIGVLGSANFHFNPFTETDKPMPNSFYAVSKLEAEQGLMHISRETGMDVVIIRPPLVYGANAPGNFASLVNAVRLSYPLPLALINNKRSFVSLDNLVSFLIVCITHPQAANQTFLVSDGQDLSTPELVRGMAQAAGVPARLIPIPVWALQAGASLLGKGDAVQRLCGNLQVDISKARSLLGWVPPLSVEEGLRRAMCV